MDAFVRYAVAATVACLAAAPASAAYFDQAHRSDALRLSDFGLKKRFAVAAPVAAAPLAAADATAILAAAEANGLFEREDGIAVHTARCGDDAARARPCELAWEADRLRTSNGVAARAGAALTLVAASAKRLTVRDWERCAPRAECDGERFTYLGPLARAPYHAVEIAYGHDAPSLVLFHARSGALLSVHYGSEPTFLNDAETLLVSFEDLNDATSHLVTSLAGEAPAIVLQCLAARMAERSFAVTFKRWSSASALDLVLTETRAGAAPAATRIPLRLERGADGRWVAASAVDLGAAGFACRQRAPGAPRPRATSRRRADAPSS